MNHFIFDPLFSKNYGSSPKSACLHCSRRKDCPYSCDRAFTGSLRCAAHQGHISARLLTTEANRLLKAISLADDSRQLLCAGETLEYALSNMLHAELSTMKQLSV